MHRMVVGGCSRQGEQTVDRCRGGGGRDPEVGSSGEVVEEGERVMHIVFIRIRVLCSGVFTLAPLAWVARSQESLPATWPSLRRACSGIGVDHSPDESNAEEQEPQ